jgi:hypothetical protein
LCRRRAVELPLLAAAFWVVAFWWLRLLPIGWTGPVLLLGAASLAVGLVIGRRSRPDAASAIIWALAALVGYVLVESALLPPGVDGAMHAGVARVIADAAGHPAGFRPLWPLDFFHSYVVGQPTLTALLAGPFGFGWESAARAGHALAYALLPIAFGGACERWAGGKASGLAAGAAAVFAARAPLHFWTWGGAPNALGIAFALAALGAGISVLRDGADSKRNIISCGLYAAAALLTHGTAVAALCWALPPLLLGALLWKGASRNSVLELLLAAVAAAILVAPYLLAFRPVLGPGEIAWVRRSALATVQGTYAGALRVLPAVLHDVPVIGGAAAAAILLWLRPLQALFPLALGAALVLLILNAVHFSLPLSALLYPDRIAALVLFPIAMLGHDAVLALRETRFRAVLPILAILLVVHSISLQRRSLRAGREHVLATRPDLAALADLDAAFPKGCAVINNYGDAGQWIPALLARPITFPQVNVLFFDEVGAPVHPCAAFRGEVRPYDVDRITPLCPGRSCISERREGRAEVFRITDATLVVTVAGSR